MGPFSGLQFSILFSSLPPATRNHSSPSNRIESQQRASGGGDGDRRALRGREAALGAQLRLPRLLQEGLRPRPAPPQVVRRRRRRVHRLRPRLRPPAQGPEGVQEVRARRGPRRRRAPRRRRRQVLQEPPRCGAGDRVRGAHRRGARVGGGGALVPALQDGQAGGQPQVHLLVGGQGLRPEELNKTSAYAYCLTSV